MNTQIFVVGKQRSGTSWLANSISNHQEVASIIHDKKGYQGIHESAFFSHVKPYFGSLQNKDNYNKFIEGIKESDLFKLSDVSDDFFTKNNFDSYASFFHHFMEEHRQSNKRMVWLEKTPAHALHLFEIKDSFPNPKFIAVKRNIIDILSSYYKLLNKKNKLGFLLREVFLTVAYEKHIDYFKKNNDILIINYCDLIEKKVETLGEVLSYLDLPYDDSILEDKYKKNTSYNGGRKPVFSSFEQFLIKFYYASLSIFPYKLYAWINKLHLKMFKRRLPSWFYYLRDSHSI